jgi:glucose-1-phosphate thymidylyltransferase
MITKGIILAGGHGTRLGPLTKVVNKQLLPLYDKPIIFYPLSVLMLAGIKDILIITNPKENKNFEKILGNGSNFGIKIQYIVQKKPNGLPEAFVIGSKFIKNQNVVLILGDNFFYGKDFVKNLIISLKLNEGSTIFTYPVSNPEDYGVVEFQNNKIKNVKEKPKKTNSNQAITGIYLFDKNAINFTKQLKPSKRKELEIVDLIKKYLKIKKLNVKNIGRRNAWLDTGNINSLHKASKFVASIENRQGLKIACLEEIALNKKWISKSVIQKQINFYGICDYSKYLKKLI